MPRYVDIEPTISQTESDLQHEENPTLAACTLAMLYVIKDIPVADVAPVKHGEWMGSVCSTCGESTSFYYDCRYCPQCGAKMDGKDGERK